MEFIFGLHKTSARFHGWSARLLGYIQSHDIASHRQQHIYLNLDSALHSNDNDGHENGSGWATTTKLCDTFHILWKQSRKAAEPRTSVGRVQQPTSEECSEHTWLHFVECTSDSVEAWNRHCRMSWHCISAWFIYNLFFAPSLHSCAKQKLNWIYSLGECGGISFLHIINFFLFIRCAWMSEMEWEYVD